MTDDNVNHPKHYTQHPSGVECITITEHFNFNLGNAIKYIWRAGQKSENSIEDLQKAQWYVTREIQRLQTERLKAFASVSVVGIGAGSIGAAFLEKRKTKKWK